MREVLDEAGANCKLKIFKGKNHTDSVMEDMFTGDNSMLQVPTLIFFSQFFLFVWKSQFLCVNRMLLLVSSKGGRQLKEEKKQLNKLQKLNPGESLSLVMSILSRAHDFPPLFERENTIFYHSTNKQKLRINSKRVILKKGRKITSSFEKKTQNKSKETKQKRGGKLPMFVATHCFSG